MPARNRLPHKVSLAAGMLLCVHGVLLVWTCTKEAAMSIENVTILDGTRPGDKNLEPLLAVLKDQLKRTGAEVHTFTLREIKLAHCIGCFGCWVETPGL